MRKGLMWASANLLSIPFLAAHAEHMFRPVEWTSMIGWRLGKIVIGFSCLRKSPVVQLLTSTGASSGPGVVGAVYIEGSVDDRFTLMRILGDYTLQGPIARAESHARVLTINRSQFKRVALRSCVGRIRRREHRAGCLGQQL